MLDDMLVMWIGDLISIKIFFKMCIVVIMIFLFFFNCWFFDDLNNIFIVVNVIFDNFCVFNLIELIIFLMLNF